MTLPEIDLAIQEASSLLKKSRHAIAFTGAGISTPSGVPDFRSAGSGLWNRSDPMKVASLTSFHRTPEVFFDWLYPLLRQISAAQPNPAHLALAGLEALGILKAIITQNIDALHQMAGSRTVLEVHGSLATLTCEACRKKYPMEDFKQNFLNDRIIPRCCSCQTILKPDIVLFEENLPLETWQTAEEHCRQADVLVVAGSSLEVLPAAILPLNAIKNGAALIVVNYTPIYLDERADVILPLDVAQILPLIYQACQ